MSAILHDFDDLYNSLLWELHPQHPISLIFAEMKPCEPHSCQSDINPGKICHLERVWADLIRHCRIQPRKLVCHFL
jgi:hypothetical protein